MRGHGYARSGRVKIGEVGDTYLSARVSGSRRAPYSVTIDWSYSDERRIIADCTCPHYEDGFLCKHIWATLLTIEREGLFNSLPNDLAAIHRDEDDLDGEDEDDYRNHECEEASEFGSLDSQSRRHGRLPSPGRDSRSPSAPSAWLGQLARISEHAAQIPARSDSPFSVEKQREAWFLLDVGESLRSGQLTVCFRYHESKKNGEFGKIKQLTVRRDEIPEFAEDEDRQLVQLLVGNQASNDASYSYYRYQDYASFSRAAVSPSMYQFLLPRLCATGRFVWQVDSSLPIEDARSIAWDDGRPWEFRLRADDDDQRQLWQLCGEVYRGDARVPLEDAVLLLSNGVVLFFDKLARLNVSAATFGWISSFRRQSTIEIPYSDRGKFLDMLYRLPQFPEIELPPALQVCQIQGTPRGRLEIKSPETQRYNSRGQLHAHVHFVYEDRNFRMEDTSAGHFSDEDNRALLRDRGREAELLEQLSDLGLRPMAARNSYHPSEFDLSLSPKRFPDVVYRLTQDGWIVESEGVRVRRPGAFNLNVTSGVDWFELDGQLDFGGATASLPDLLKALHAKENYIRLDDGSQGILPEVWLKKYGYLAGLAETDGDSLRFAPSQALLLDALLAEQENVAVDRQFAAFRRKLQAFDGIKPSKEPRGFHGKLREYQKEGLGWLHFLREFRLGGCLADDMGLGKTVQVLALLQSRRLSRPKKGQVRKPSIVVVPKSLVFNWIDEATRFTPNLRMLDYTGTDRKTRLEESDDCDLLVTTYGTLRRDIISLKDTRFDYAILDESQAIKNHNAQAAKACRLLDADHRLAMTGTPIENHLGELWSLFEFLNPGMLGRSTKFNGLTKNGKDDNGSLALLARALRPFLLRRTKEQVLPELPEKTEQTLYCRLSGRQRKAYEKLRDYYRRNLSDRVKEVGLKKAKIHVLEALLRLRQAACHPGLLDRKQTKMLSPKLETLLEQLREVVNEGHKALVFSQFTSLLAIVRQHLDKENAVYEYLDGRTRKRADKVKRFQTDPACPLFLISLKAGGQGLNLTAADYVFILDPWWNPAVEAQAIDRTYRIGQTRRVFAYRIICSDTVEEKILELQQSKRELADAIVSADQSFVRNLTTEDLELLLS